MDAGNAKKISFDLFSEGGSIRVEREDIDAALAKVEAFNLELANLLRNRIRALEGLVIELGKSEEEGNGQ